MKTTKTQILRMLFGGVIGLLSLSCEVDDLPLPERAFYGPEVELGDGTVRSVMEFDEQGRPESLGVIISETALSGLSHEMENLVLLLPQQARRTPFDHIGFDWNPHGHEPEGIYTTPHFDIHFYMISVEDRMQIGVNDPLSEELPDAKYMPDSFIALPGSVPMMGKHWIEPTVPELNGGEFTQSFLLGSYNKKFTFYEPMITVDYLKEKSSEEFDLDLPEAYEHEGKFYPTGYSISYDADKKEYLVNLTGLTRR